MAHKHSSEKVAAALGRLWRAAGTAGRATGRAGSRAADELDAPVTAVAGLAGTHAYNQIVDKPMTGTERAAAVGVPTLLALTTRGRLQRARQAGQQLSTRHSNGRQQLPPNDPGMRAYYNRPGASARLAMPTLAAGIAPTATTNITGSQSMLANLQQSTNEFSNQLSDYLASGKPLPEYLAGMGTEAAREFMAKPETQQLLRQHAGSIGNLARQQLKATLDDPELRQRIRRASQPVTGALREVGGGLAGSTAGMVLGNIFSRMIMPEKQGDKVLTAAEHNRRKRRRRMLSLILSGAGAVGGYAVGQRLARPKTEQT